MKGANFMNKFWDDNFVSIIIGGWILALVFAVAVGAGWNPLHITM